MADPEGETFNIAMHLPKAVAASDGIIANDGSVIYRSTVDRGVTAAIQSLEKDGVSIGIRSIILMENSSAGTRYSYDFDFPSGYRMVQANECTNAKDLEPGAVCVLNEDNEIVDYIEPSLGKDANGKTVATHYEINGNTLTQVADLAGDESFPIILKSTSHPNKTTTARLKKSEVKDVMNKIQEDIDAADAFMGSPFYWVVVSVANYFGGCGIAADAITRWLVVRGYKNKLKERKKMYKNKYDKMSKGKRLKIVTVSKWKRHGSNDGIYNIYSEKLSIVNA